VPSPPHAASATKLQIAADNNNFINSVSCLICCSSYCE
jgi:hypothetical protein